MDYSKEIKEELGLVGYIDTFNSPYEHSYSSDEAYKAYKRLSAKYLKNKFAHKPDLEAIERSKKSELTSHWERGAYWSEGTVTRNIPQDNI